MAKFLGSAVILMVLGTTIWVATRTPIPSSPPLTQAPAHIGEVPTFDFTINAERGYIRISGIANLPNGVVLVSTLDKIGEGTLDVKEALVMNRTFAIEFGPQLQAQYHLIGRVDALTPGPYRISVEFDPAHQSPFTSDFLVQGTSGDSSPAGTYEASQYDIAAIRVAKTVTIGTPEEQQQAQVIVRQYRQEIRQHLGEALGTLSGLWQRLRTEYQQERTQGVFSRTNARSAAWRTWSEQWQRDLKATGESWRLFDGISQASPYHHTRNTLVVITKYMQTLIHLYYEVLLNERPLDDRELLWSERQVHLAFGDAIAQLGQYSAPLPPQTGDPLRTTVVVSAGLANVRSGPGMSHGVISQIKKDEALEVLGEKGEWFQVQLPDGRPGWIHQNVGSKSTVTVESAVEARRPDAKRISPERRVSLQLEPVALQSISIEFIPRPTEDEFKIYADVEQQLQHVPNQDSEERRRGEPRVLHRVSEKYGISPELAWNTYLKVQGWEVKR